jgi:HAD superfamily hydrolase (TIGR01549 family)
LEDLIQGYEALNEYRMIVPPKTLIEMLIERLGLDRVRNQELEKIVTHYIDAPKNIIPHVNKEIHDVIPAIYEKDIKMGIITNTSFSTGSIWFLLDKLGISNYIDVVIASCDVGMAKPDPRIFHLALDELKVESREAMHVGDNYNDDVVGALRAGVKPILYTGLWEAYDSYRYATWGKTLNPDKDIVVIDSLKHLLDMIR